MKRLNIDILGRNEVSHGEHHIYYSGGDNARNRNGVAVIVKREIAKAVEGFTPMSGNVALLKINSSPSNIQVYPCL